MDYVRRTIQSEIEKYIHKQKVILIFGPRRVGKTFLLRQITDNYSGRQLVLNGESVDTTRMLEPRSIDNYKNLFGSVNLLAIDEAQHIPDIGMDLKLLVDEIPHLTIIATGSSTFDLHNQVGEPLVGRHIPFRLSPLSVEELVLTEGAYDVFSKNGNRLVYGQYPELLHLMTATEKQEYLSDIVNSYLLRDILMLDGVKNSQKIHDLLRLIAWQIGGEVSLDELSKQLRLSRNTVERYLDLLQKVFVLFRIGGFSRNLRKEITKSSKWYFLDTGIRNAVLHNYTPFEERPSEEQGALWENFIISERVKRSLNHRLYSNFYFWRTYDHQEIDLIEENGMHMSAFELKSGRKSPAFPKVFTEAYPNASLAIINRENYLEYCKK